MTTATHPALPHAHDRRLRLMVAAAAVVLIGITIIAFLIWALVQRRARTQNS